MFQYYLPGVARDDVTRDYLQQSPLAEILWDLLAKPALFEARVRMFAVHSAGPDGSSGTIVAVMPTGDLQFTPGVRAGQQWIEVATASPAYWIGLDPRAVPGPMDLARDHIVAGEEHELGDGRVWMCPTVRRQGFSNGLPASWGIDPKTGDFVASPLPRYAAAWSAAEQIFDAQLSGEITRPEVLKLCVQMLGVNYRVGVHEVTLLKLLDDTTWEPIWRAATDLSFVESWVEQNGKKKD